LVGYQEACCIDRRFGELFLENINLEVMIKPKEEAG
jgi:hypothetical protein